MIKCIFMMGVLMLAKKPLPYEYIGIVNENVGYVAFVGEKFEASWVELIDINGESSVFEMSCKRVESAEKALERK